MELADILAKHAVLTCTGVSDKRQIFDILAQKAAELTAFPASQILSTLVGREELGSTGLGNGIAIPHGKIQGLKGVTAVFARLDQPIDFDSVDDEPVDLVVMLLAPGGDAAGPGRRRCGSSEGPVALCPPAADRKRHRSIAPRNRSGAIACDPDGAAGRHLRGLSRAQKRQ